MITQLITSAYLVWLKAEGGPDLKATAPADPRGGGLVFVDGVQTDDATLIGRAFRSWARAAAAAVERGDIEG